MTRPEENQKLKIIGEKIYLKTNRYCRWLTNRVIVKAEAEKIYLTIPREYGKYFKEIEADKTELKVKSSAI